MILGFATVKHNAVITHRDSFILSNISVVSVRRPYLAGVLLLSLGSTGFGLAFHDLLYGHELMILASISMLLSVLGTQIAQLTLLSKDLKGTELSSAIWGTPHALQKIRANIIQERQRSTRGGSHESE